MAFRAAALAFLAAVLLALIAVASTAGAQDRRAPPCHDATKVAKHLAKKYDEAPVAFGVQSNGNLLQVYASDDTWTVVSTTPAGVSCIVAAGKRWESLPSEMPGEPT